MWNNALGDGKKYSNKIIHIERNSCLCLPYLQNKIKIVIKIVFLCSLSFFQGSDFDKILSHRILWWSLKMVPSKFLHFHFQFRQAKYRILKCRSSHIQVFLGKGVLKICSKFTREHPCWCAISIKLQSNFIEIRLPHGCSPVSSSSVVNFCCLNLIP